jgi:hypothetical protein
MSEFNLVDAIDILTRTPKIINNWLKDLSEDWSLYKSDEDRWSAFDILGHLIQGEKTDWIPRIQLILQGEGTMEFEPFDRYAQFEESKGKSMRDLLDEFQDLREENLEVLKGLNLQPADYDLEGKHPDLGIVNLRELLSTWIVHDLEHISQIAEELAKKYKSEVGPWKAYLRILD